MRLWVKLLLATGAVILICLVVAEVLAYTFIRQQFDRFVKSQEREALERLGPVLAGYYQQHNHSWAGLEEVWRLRRERLSISTTGMRLLLLDPNRRVILDTQGDLTGQVVSSQVWENGLPIVVEGEEVGRLLSGAGLLEARYRSQLEGRFINTVLLSLVGAGLIGALVAIVVSAVLALQITAPARELTRAARGIASGNLKQHVVVHSGDELGEVSQAFNEMAAILERQELLRRHLVADIAHELRTPLTVMQVELASLQDGLSEPTPEAFSSLSEEVGLLSRLVEDLRLLSLMDAGSLPLQPEPVSIGEALRNAAQQVGASAGEKGLSMECQVTPDLPPARADPDRLQQVLLNLLHNAIRHTPAGGRIVLSARPEGAYLHLQVADTGEGIPAQDLPYIFDRFYRSGASRSREGSGLGLSIARGLVEAMGGRIWAESTLGRGTTIHFTLPRAV